jgi:BirA family transcriptional regulator, biotin operon repressor / biotin---[acetyl-CoA-carboxylase] ligase
MSTAEKLDRLIADQLQAALPCSIIGRNIIVLDQTGSTNDAIFQVASPQGAAVSPGRHRLGEGGSPPSHVDEGLVLFAEHQTAGRGQRGNRWESAAGEGLWFSILLRPEIQLSDSGRLTIWAIEAISDVIRTEFGLEPAIKLPNDVQLNGYKVAGVLVEMRAQDNAPHLAVVGIGINVNQCRDDFPAELQGRATSLAMSLGQQVERQNLAVALLRNLDLTYREKFAKTVAAFNSSPAPTTTRDKRAVKSRTA